MGIDAFILVNITDYFFGLRDRLWGKLILGSKGSFSQHQDASLPPVFGIQVQGCRVCLFLSVQGLRWNLSPSFLWDLEWPTGLPTWETLSLVASGLPSGDTAAHPSPWCSLSTLVGLPSSWFLLLLQNSCVCPVGPLGLHIPRVFSYFTHWLTPWAPLSELSCILDSFADCQRHVFNWTNQKKENSFGPLYFLLITHPSREDGKECIL